MASGTHVLLGTLETRTQQQRGDHPESTGLSDLLARMESLLDENRDAEERAQMPLARITGEPAAPAPKADHIHGSGGYEERFSYLLNVFNEQIINRRNQLERLESFV